MHEFRLSKSPFRNFRSSGSLSLKSECVTQDILIWAFGAFLSLISLQQMKHEKSPVILLFLSNGRMKTISYFLQSLLICIGVYHYCQSRCYLITQAVYLHILKFFYIILYFLSFLCRGTKRNILIPLTIYQFIDKCNYKLPLTPE